MSERERERERLSVCSLLGLFDWMIIDCIFQGIDISCSSSARGQLYLGTHEGNVYALDKQLNINAFTAHTKSLTHMCQLKQSSFLFTIGVHFPKPIFSMHNRIDLYTVCARGLFSYLSLVHSIY